MVWNDYQPEIEVDSQTYQVRADGQLLTRQPVRITYGSTLFSILRMMKKTSVIRCAIAAHRVDVREAS